MKCKMHKILKIDELAVIFTVVLVTFSEVVGAAHLRLSNNYLLDYELSNGNRSIEFKIQAINVTGWVGIGVNNGRANMSGSDLFMGGYNANNRSSYGRDYHVPINSGNGQPILDALQNWVVVNATENNRTTIIHINRLLNTGDRAQDLVIENKTMYLLWSYNANTDDVTVRHTQRGSRLINLVGTGGGGGGGTPSTTTTTPKTTTRRTNATTSRTNSTTPSGASSVHMKMCILIFGVLTTSILNEKCFE